ncbi:transglycosylase domain-containing protein [Thermocrispum agreste]|uniref:Penicillin-binding protein n=1 Tax=Thermocrispum agreste TaxID=37925 RepID=A0A2W4LTD7_9PSEU|nr:transglycosylase domain-containing protein [Thermocrispum agreste]PZM98976.1 MAG: penicillin-binding protein [Thermocrispum agreste]
MRRTDGILKLLGLCLLAGVLVAGLLFPVVGGAGLLSNQASATVENTSTELANEAPPLVTTITDRDGRPIATLYNQYRIPTGPDEISDAMKWAIISVEDRRFYEHNGVDWKGTVRAAISNTSGGQTQGASTLTQQYVKNYLINVVYWNDNDPKHRIGRQKAQEQSIARKLKEARIAINLESKMTKEEILTGYLNVVEFSRRIFGVGAAAKAYFNTTAKELDPAQAALLAGMVNNPAALDPWNHPEAAKKRRNLVLDMMVRNRKLSKEDAERYKKQGLGVVPGGPKKPPANCVGAGATDGFFCQYVEDYLVNELGMDRDELYSGGYTIRTTLDRKANKAAAKATEEQVPKENDDVVLTLSLVKPGKKRHEVIALAANRDYGGDKERNETFLALPAGVYNMQGAGSSYKIFTAAAALEKGVVGILDRVPAPGHYTSKVFGGGNPRCGQRPDGVVPYCVQNYAGTPGGNPTLQQALANSPNTTFVILEERTGMKPIVDMAYRLGMRKTMSSNMQGKKPDPSSNDPLVSEDLRKHFGPSENSPGKGSFTLGPAPLSGLELANVGATIISDGRWCPPTPILEVRDRNGKPVKLKEPKCEQVISKDLAHALADALSKDHVSGTAAGAARKAGWDRPMIGKTGTAQNHTASTFVGATPFYAGAAMIFQPDGNAQPLCVGGSMGAYRCGSGNMFGGVIPAQTWFNAMKPIHEGLPKKSVPKAPEKYLHAN